jgi:hypothetical protein
MGDDLSIDQYEFLFSPKKLQATQTRCKPEVQSNVLSTFLPASSVMSRKTRKY